MDSHVWAFLAGFVIGGMIWVGFMIGYRTAVKDIDYASRPIANAPLYDPKDVAFGHKRVIDTETNQERAYEGGTLGTRVGDPLDR